MNRKNSHSSSDRPWSDGHNEPTWDDDQAASDATWTDLGNARTLDSGSFQVPRTSLRPGERINQYELIRPLGKGGMGQVFLARDTKLGRLVAMKFLDRTTAETAERFVREARMTARCNHENIVVIHDVGEHARRPYMVLEYLQGSTLRELMHGHPMSASRAVELLVPVVRALVHAHDFGIVHRDLKPENIVLTDSGTIKVLDFGVAKLLSDDASPAQTTQTAQTAQTAQAAQTTQTAQTAQTAQTHTDSAEYGSKPNLTRDGSLLGTLPYMSPEQFGTDEIDHLSDIWAVGVILYELIAGRHPLHRTSKLMVAVMDEPMPQAREATAEVPDEVAAIIDRCLLKDKRERIASARDLLAALESIDQGRRTRQIEDNQTPYTGLTAFQEADAARFFGRTREIVSLIGRIRERPLVGVVGPSGVGKSSFIRAGVIPALKRSGEPWEALTVRPGPRPLVSLASAIETAADHTAESSLNELTQAGLADRLRREPGVLGTLLRDRARRRRCQVILFVDQFEELYTLVADPAERDGFIACLLGVADEPTTPLRVVISMRSDLLDRAAANPSFIQALTPGLLFLPPPGRDSLRDALIRPLELADYHFESEDLVTLMLDELEGTPGALPLLQFAAVKLWEARDRERRCLPADRYHAMGGVAGALSAHADSVIEGLAPRVRKLTRRVLLRLVTPERTRAVVDMSDLVALADARDDATWLIEHLASARLLVVQAQHTADEPSVELVHESLIQGWPTLRRWLDEDQEDAAFAQHVCTAAKQWDAKDRPAGLLWRGDAAEEARLWYHRQQVGLSPLQQDYLHAVLALRSRSARTRRFLVAGTITLLSLLVAAAAVALVTIRDAEQTAMKQAELARDEAERARTAEHKNREQYKQLIEKEQQRRDAEQRADETSEMSREQLAKANVELRAALEKATKAEARARKNAEQADQATRLARDEAREKRLLAERESAASNKLKQLLDKERRERKELERRLGKTSTTLKP